MSVYFGDQILISTGCCFLEMLLAGCRLDDKKWKLEMRKVETCKKGEYFN